MSDSKEKKREYDLNYYQNNKEKIHARWKAWYDLNKEAIRERYKGKTEMQYEQHILRQYIFNLSLNPNHRFQAGTIQLLREYTGIYSHKDCLNQYFIQKRQDILDAYDNMESNQPILSTSVDPVIKRKYTAVEIKTQKIERRNKKLDEKAAAFKAKLDAGFIMEISNI